MSGYLFFPAQEYDQRLTKVRHAMDERELDACVVTSPENIYYLTGLDHQGYFGTHFLVVPREGEMVLAARAIEASTVEYQVGNARFAGYSDTEDPGSALAARLKDTGLGNSRIGLQKQSLFFPPSLAESLTAALDRAQWVDISGLVEVLRLVKSPRELEYVKRAARVSVAMMRAAIDAASIGIGEREIAAEAHRAMILEGGEVPGFGPFIRSTPTLPYEHMVWGDHVLQHGDILFVELSGCVRRYHAPMGRLLFSGAATRGADEIAALCLAAQQRVVETARPGVTGAEVYQAWQDVVDEAGLAHYRRHHCGYAVGIGFPPAWTGGVGVVSLHVESEMVLEAGMVFHQLSWLLGCGRGDYFVSDTAVVTEDGCELVTGVPRELTVI